MRIALGIEYDGTSYCGWQRQDHHPSIQQAVETALSKVANETITVICAGRTDAGVHASEQVVHLNTQAMRTMDSWVLGTNSWLPADIRILWARKVTEDFHARYSARSRLYRYVIHNHKVASALLRHRAMWYSRSLDERLMQQAATYLLGEHDFSSFRGSGCQSKSVKRYLSRLNVSRTDNLINIEVQANAFLLHMVRNIVGALLQVGAGKQPPFWIQKVLQARDRRQAAITAPAAGLYLTKVEYPMVYL